METHYASKGSSVLAKKLWGLLRVAFLTTRKRLISSKRKLMMELINLTIIIKSKRLLRESLNNLISLHGHGHGHHTKGAPHAAGIMKKRRSTDHHPLDYEFSCSNSPIINPVVYSIVSGRHFNSRGHRGRHFKYHSPLGIKEYLGDLNVVSCVDQDIDNALMLLPPQTPDQYNFNLHLDGNDPYAGSSPVSVVKVSDYLSEEEEDRDKDTDDDDPRNAPWVDDEAEDFIKRFKEQLRAQTTTGYYLQHTTTTNS